MNPKQSIYDNLGGTAYAVTPFVDLSVLLPRLLFFETVIVKSNRLREVPGLIRAFGETGFRQLLDSGVLKLSSEFVMLITDMAQNGVRELPLGQFSFGVATLADREGMLRNGLRSLQGIRGLNNVDREALQEKILSGLVRPAPDHGAQIQAQVEFDLRNNTPALKAAILNRLHQNGGVGNNPDLTVRVDEVRERIFHVITNLTNQFGMSAQQEHEILAPSITAVATLNQRIADMAAYSAIAGFKDSEAPLLFGKLAGIIGPHNPRPIEEQFARVVAIANLPDFVTDKQIDVDRLLKARDSAECREFRSWLSGLDRASDEQIAEMIGGMRNKLGGLVRGGPGKLLRLAVTTAFGVIPGAGLVAGAVAGAVDSFLVEKIFPTSGAFAFLTQIYPSLFVSGQM